METQKITIRLSTHKNNKRKHIDFEMNNGCGITCFLTKIKEMKTIIRTKKQFEFIDNRKWVYYVEKDDYHYYFFNKQENAEDIMKMYYPIRGYRTIKLYTSETIEIPYELVKYKEDSVVNKYRNKKSNQEKIEIEEQADKDINDYITKLNNVDVEPIVEQIIKSVETPKINTSDIFKNLPIDIKENIQEKLIDNISNIYEKTPLWDSNGDNRDYIIEQIIDISKIICSDKSEKDDYRFWEYGRVNDNICYDDYAFWELCSTYKLYFRYLLKTNILYTQD